MDELQKPPRPIKLKASGEPDMRGQGEGSRATRFGADDGRPRPGRRKGSKDIKTIVQAVQEMSIAVDIPGVPRRINTFYAVLLKLREKALKGDTKAINMLIEKFGQYAPPSVEPDLTAQLLDEDQQILNFARERGLLLTPIIADESGVKTPRSAENASAHDDQARIA
jgi:hypothetical protein